MNNSERHTEIRYLSKYLNNSWILNLYVLKSDSTEVVEEKTIESLFDAYLTQLESKCMSAEFEYLKIGFAFLHFGRRGVGLNIWHIGVWNRTYEIFCNNWYCYDRDIYNMELLDDAEPRICHYEIKAANCELERILGIADSTTTKDEFINEFVKLSS